MKASENQPPDVSLDERLVAYLDGQLAADESEQIESQLASDPAIRHRLQALDRVWNALDVLPRTTASPAFTRSTVEMAAVATSRPNAKKQIADKDEPKRWHVPAGLVACLVGLLLGVGLTYAIATAPERRALRDLPIALHATALENAGSIEFLRLLSTQTDKPLEPFLTEEVREENASWSKLRSMSTAERRGWLEGLPPEELGAVDTAVDRFIDRPTRKQQTLRTFVTELAAEPDAKQLAQTALGYQAMIGRLPQSEQARLRQLDPEERLRHVQRHADHLARQAALELTDFQRATLRAEVDKLVASDGFKRQARRITEGIPSRWRDDRREQMARQQPQLILYGVTRHIARVGDRPRGGERRGDPDRQSRFERYQEEVVEPLTEVWTGWADQLETALPARAQQALREAAERGDAERAYRLARVLSNAAPEDLSDVFADLPEDRLEQVLLMPREQFIDELSRQSFNFDGPPDADRRGPPRRGR